MSKVESSLEQIKQAPSLFEDLGRASHHYSDLKTKGRGLDGEEGDPLEVLILRSDIFDVCISWLEATSAFLNGIAKLQEIDKTSKDRTTTMAQSAMLKHRRAQGLDNFLQMLKRGAEAGNDLFGAITAESYFPRSMKEGAQEERKSDEEEEEEENEKDEEDEQVMPRDVGEAETCCS